MSLTVLQEIWKETQQEKTKALKTWTPSKDLISAQNLSDFPRLMKVVSTELEKLFDTNSIHALEHKLVKAEAELSPDSFRIWNLDRGNRARAAGEAQAKHSRDKILQLMGLG